MAQDNTSSSIHGKEIATDSSRINISNPYTSHHSDHPGLVLISKPLNGNNYSTWKRAMTLALNSKNKLGFVDGSIEQPPQATEPENQAAWSRCNDMVHSWIINTLDPEISDSVIYYTTANEVWEDLRERFSQSNAPRIFEIQRDIAYFRQDQLSVSAYYTRLKGLWDELSSYSEVMHGAQQDQQKMMQFLMGLNDTYSGIRGQILLMSPLPSIRQAYSSVSQEEKQRLLSSTHFSELGGGAAMAVRSNNGSKFVSQRRYNNGSSSFSSPSPENPSWGRFGGVNGRGERDEERRRFGGLMGVNGRGERETRFGREGLRFNERNGQRFNERDGLGFGRERDGPKGRPQCSHCGQMGHWAQTCYALKGYPAAHPRGRPMGPGQFQNRPAVNSVSDGPSREADQSPVIGISEAQIKQVLFLLDIKNEASTSQTPTKPGSGYEEDDWFGETA